jgi:hypothetical protein
MLNNTITVSSPLWDGATSSTRRVNDRSIVDTQPVFSTPYHHNGCHYAPLQETIKLLESNGFPGGG